MPYTIITIFAWLKNAQAVLIYWIKAGRNLAVLMSVRLELLSGSIKQRLRK